jgi:hypothetical protein
MSNQIVDLTPNFSLLTGSSEANVFEVVGRDSKKEVTNDSSQKKYSEWEDNVIDIDSYEVIPYGKHNRLDRELQEAIFPNHLAPRALTKKGSLLFGEGPLLYKKVFKDGKYSRDYIEDPVVEEFLKANNYQESILSSIVDFYYTEGCYHKVLIGTSQRLGVSNGKAIIDYEELSNCRLARRKNAKSKEVTHVLVGDWANNEDGYKVYPLFDPTNPTAHKVSISYSKYKSFGLKYYALPDLYGSLPWIKRASAIPYILEALTNNSLNLKFHIKSPKKYWDDVEKMLKKNLKAGETYNPKLLKQHQDKIFKAITDVLSGVDNVGKFWHSQEIQEIIGGKTIVHGWTIEPIEQKTKDFVLSQLKIAEFAAFSTTAGIGLHNALLGVGADGKSDSGSEQVYAYINHKLTETIIPEMVILKTWNALINNLWPDKKLFLGFYFEIPTLQQETSEAQRLQNNT